MWGSIGSIRWISGTRNETQGAITTLRRLFADGRNSEKDNSAIQDKVDPRMNEQAYSMKLFRIHAYEVIPQRLMGTATVPAGGAFNAPVHFRTSLEKYLAKAQLSQQPPVSFCPTIPDGATQAVNDVRSQILDYAFGAPATAKAAATSLATRLSRSMDDRSASCLLVLSAYRDTDQRRFVGWAFPKDEPYAFSARNERATIQVIENAFTRSAHYRKAVLFQGKRQDDHFWDGNVIDKQATIAEYWVKSFLQCDYLINSKTGTQLLARILRKTHEDLDARADKDQITAAVLSVRGSQRRRWSVRRFANEYLTGTAKSTFLSNAPPAAVTTEFVLDKPELEVRVNLRVFRLEDDVIVMAPFESINQSVRITGLQQRRLRCEGNVVEEKVRSKRVR
ncbi:MAG: hypothetical protein KDA69_00500 [Planctomycetaceae bacterium]|nr:hypothetical protein [Planctomycetaceae bacterium]